MEVYFGGAFQGKLDYVLKKKGNLKVADGRDCDEKQLQSADVVNHLHLLIQRRIAAGESTDTLIDELYAVNPQMILICDEVGSGIVPLERKTGFTGKLSDVCCVRQWQNPTGWSGFYAESDSA